MKTIGIITFNNSHNFGGNLQAYATQKSLENLGYEAELINYNVDYENKNNENNSKLTWIKKSLLGNKKQRCYFIRRVLNSNDFKIRNTKFINFRNNYLKNSSKVFLTEKELIDNPPIYDIYLCGSDQIWNPTYYNYTNAFFLNFVPEGKKKIAYASSVGISELPEDSRERMKKWISKIDYLSCRETDGAKLISELVGRSVKQVVDPTLLIKSENWFEEETKEALIKEDYVLCYSLWSEETLVEKVKEFSAYKNLKIINIYPLVGDFSGKITNMYNVGPVEFVNLIKYCKGVITDSFHGMVFAINFNKPFYIGMKSKGGKLNDNSRKSNILDDLKIKNRILGDESDLDSDFFNMNYDEVNEILDRMRKDSYEYLINALEE